MDNGLQHRFAELAARAEARGRYTYTQFLTLAEQDLLCRMEARLESPFRWMGGYQAAERRLACFGREETLGYPPESPIVCLSIAPAAPRFAGELGHRDYFGAVMALGVKRELLGDLVLTEGGACLFCMKEIAPYFSENLRQAGRTGVTCALCQPPEALLTPPDPTVLTVASPRLDGLIAAGWKLSRGESQQLVARGLVFLDGRLEESPSRQVAEGTVISVRGLGRMRYLGQAGHTRRGRDKVEVILY